MTTTTRTTAGDTTAAVTADGVRAAIGAVYDPCSQAWGRPLSLLDLGLVRDVRVAGGSVTVRLGLTTPFCMAVAVLMRSVERRVGELAGVTGVTVDIDPAAPWDPGLMTEEGRRRLARHRAADRRAPAGGHRERG